MPENPALSASGRIHCIEKMYLKHPKGTTSFLAQYLEWFMKKHPNAIDRVFLIPENRKSYAANNENIKKCIEDLAEFGPFTARDLVLIDRCAEAGYSLRSRLGMFRDLAKQIGLPCSNIVYVSQNPKIAIGGANAPSWLWFHHYAISVARAYRGLEGSFDFENAGPRIFVPNFKRRPHRIAVAKAALDSLGSRALVSWGGADWANADSDFEQTFPVLASRNLPEPDPLDLPPTIGNTSDVGMPLEAVRDCYLHLVPETEVTAHSARFTEKSLKPIAAHRPFLIFGPVGTLKRLRELGFVTFDSVFSERYDEIEDAEARLTTILMTIRQIDAMPRRRFRARVNDICRHNQMHLTRNLETVLRSEFERGLLRILASSA